jgi:DUF4097 and DUF4098 domain-containing protein YvlB
MNTNSNQREGFLSTLIDGFVDRAVLGSGPEETERVDETIDAGDLSRLTVESICGDVTITTGQRDAVRIRGEKRTRAGADHLEKLVVRTDVRDGELRIVVEPVRRNTNVRAVVDLDIEVPPALMVEHVEVVNGEVSLRGVAGDVGVEVANGDIEVVDVDGFVSLQTANGSVVARGCRGIDAAETANGDIEVEVRELRRSATVSTPNGTITLELAPDLDADVLAETLVGRVEVDLDLDVTSRSRRSLIGIHGAGGNVVEAEAVNGTVVVTGA